MLSHIAPLFVFLFTAQLIILSVVVIKHRVKNGVGLGEGENAYLKRTIAAHNNFVQYTPFMLIILIYCEVSTINGWFCLLLGIAMLAGRILHSYSLLVAELREPSTLRYRQIGMMMTFATLAIGATALLLKHYA